MPQQQHPLTTKQQSFFQRHRQTIQAVESAIFRQKESILAADAAMRGALQVIVDDLGLTGRVSLSEDCSTLIEETESTQQPAALVPVP